MDQEHDNPENWKLGVFYFNPKDKRILLPKRLAFMGYTLNFANPVAIIILLLLISLIFVF